MSRHSRYSKYVVATRRERLEWWLMPKICLVLGHPEEQKMYCTICRRCRIVLKER